VRIKKKNLERLASFSALGAGTLGAGALGMCTQGVAEASVINQSLGNVTVGFSSAVPSTRVRFPGASVRFYTARSTKGTGGSRSAWFVKFMGSNVAFRLNRQSNTLALLSGFNTSTLKTRWNSVGSKSGPNGLVGTRYLSGHFTTTGFGPYPTYQPYRTFSTTGAGTFGAGSFSNEYALFQFQYNGSPVYGWLELSQNVSAENGPDVTLAAYGYDLPDQGTPEPSTMALSGLAAFGLGAAGLRRWRAARKPAA
jgi:hypothetical protein